MAKKLQPSYSPPTQAQVNTSIKEAAESVMERLKFLRVIAMEPGYILAESYAKVSIKRGLLELVLYHPERMSPIVVEPFYGGYMLLDGHHRLEAIKEVRLRMIWVVVVEVIRTQRRR